MKKKGFILIAMILIIGIVLFKSNIFKLKSNLLGIQIEEINENSSIEVYDNVSQSFNTMPLALNTGHSVNIRFAILYVGSEFGIGYNFGSSESTTFICQYTVSHSDTAYNNHTIAITDIRNASTRLSPSLNSGYEITGWTKTASANPTIYSLSLSGTTAANKGDTIYLVAKRTAQTYTLNYNANGGADAPIAQSASSTATNYTFTISDAEPTRDGYIFKGWSTSPTAVEAQYYSNGSINVSGATTLYAVWEKEVLYTVTYTDGVDGEIVFPDQSYEGLKAGNATPAYIGTPSRDGYTFMGWAPAINPVVTGEDATNGNIIYTATWEVTPEIKDFTKELVENEQALPDNIKLLVNNINITYPNENGTIVIPRNGEITLLYKITVTGNRTTPYSINDEGATYIGGNSMVGTLNNMPATIYVTKTFTEKDVTPEGMVENTATVTPGKGTNDISSSTTITPVELEADIPLIIGWYDNDQTTLLERASFLKGQMEPAYSKEIPTKPDDNNYSYNFIGWVKLDTPLNNDDISYVAQYGVLNKDATYKVEWYDENGNIIKTSEIRTGVLGSIVTITDNDKIVDGYTFIEGYENNNLSDEIDENGSVVLKLYFKTDNNNSISNEVNTGDNSHTVLYIVLCVISLAVIIGLVFILKKKNRKKD